MKQWGWVLAFASLLVGGQALYPRESETRQTKTLDGVWDFVLGSGDDHEKGFRESWYTKSLSQLKNETVLRMPVPSSYNDVTQDRRIRDHVGWVWYESGFFVSTSWAKETIFLRFDSVHYHAQVFLNGKSIVNHTGGHLPFKVDITQSVKFDKQNKLTVAVDNTLTASTVPQGNVLTQPQNPGYKGTYRRLQPFFDFFNYAGIHRSVKLYAVPSIYIHDISVIPDIDDAGNGIIEYSFVYDDKSNLLKQNSINSSRSDECAVEIYDKQGTKVSSAFGCTGTVTIKNPFLWWPLGMSSEPGYLYTAKFILTSADKITDVYYEKVGVRTVQVVNQTLLINNEPFYFKGIAKHEDSAIRGRGLDIPLIIKDMNLIKWLGANSFRTSHYPYSEEQMDIADETGIVVIDECPAVGLKFFGDELFDQHVSSLQALIQRDKNRPSVIMWSIANEPNSEDSRADDYFKKLTTVAKRLDSTRPLTAAISASHASDLMAKYLDVLMINRYFGWYQDTGSVEVIRDQLVYDLTEWHAKHPSKPLLMSEYGADTVPGLHSSPSYVFTEEYQAELLMQFFEGFDILKQKGILIGEMIWNFADFMTDQSTTRVLGNRKGIFTRDRQPKTAAHILRCRYLSLQSNSTAAAAASGDNHVLCPRRLL